jgi:uncharacterized repeat protein (TIGR03803 family)
VAVIEACESRRLLSGTPVLSSLASLATGNVPDSTLAIDSQGNLYGTALQGGAYNDGTIFEVRAGTNTETVLASFNGTDGQNPEGKLTIDAQGNLYGMAGGGAGGDGVAFELPAGSGSITDLVTFDGSNGYIPTENVVFDAQGNLFGVMSSGGNGDSSIFEITAGAHAFSIVATMDSTVGGFASRGLAMDAQGDLYGATSTGGPNYGGTIYELPAGSNTIQVLAPFAQNGIGMGHNEVVVDAQGNVFAVEEDGGTDSNGGVDELAAGSNTIQTIASFTGSNGADPRGSLLVDAAGDVFGATDGGGANGLGTVWEVPAGPGSLTTVFSFSSSTGEIPDAACCSTMAFSTAPTPPVAGATVGPSSSSTTSMSRNWPSPPNRPTRTRTPRCRRSRRRSRTTPATC